MAEQPAADRQSLEARIIEKAWRDEAFRRELLTDPRSAIGRELGVDLPADIEINVVEETPSTLFLVVPLDPAKETPPTVSADDLDAAPRKRPW